MFTKENAEVGPQYLGPPCRGRKYEGTWCSQTMELKATNRYLRFFWKVLYFCIWYKIISCPLMPSVQLLSFYLLSIAEDRTQGFANIRPIPYQKRRATTPALPFLSFYWKKKKKWLPKCHLVTSIVVLLDLFICDSSSLCGPANQACLSCLCLPDADVSEWA